ncbi:hypothetical protein [Hydrogenimonas cancrithermarum]|uniref:Uncharacterized protein n=1 Tax=Hydrogenimonas cancrithermarum TaxID=2993563 RepID=A0ABN6WUI1_9BACT|nr:hypothetical protein [Hydrogenimonas cancrithermarum]BDY12404.1 hypothetical protein HCR_07160 [Hydrogenimonas cancrithermarum]
MTEKVETSATCEEVDVDEAKREFMKKFGKYAATAPLGMYLLLGAGASKAQASSTGTCTWHNNHTITYTLKDDQNIYVEGPGANDHYTVTPSNPLYDWFRNLL